MDQPMTPAAPASTPPTSPPPDSAEDASMGYEICIRVSADGSFAVSKEALDEDDQAEPAPADGQAPEPADAHETSVTSFEDALKAALRIFKQNPVSGDAQTQFDAGFGGGTGRY